MSTPPLVVGDLSGPLAVVDGSGTVRPGRAPWSVEWGVGAEDRWHIASEEVAVRQTRLDETPVSVTSMRVPGGDVVQRVAGVAGGTGRAVLLEFENNCGTSVTLAVVVRPVGSDAITRVSIEDRCLRIDDRRVLVLDRPPGATVAVEADVAWTAISAGPGRGDAAVTSRAGSASGALLTPLLHGQSVRLMVAVDGVPPPFVSAEAVASGWESVAMRAASVDVADLDVRARWRRELLTAVMEAGSDDLDSVASAATVLDRVGLPGEGDRARGRLLAAFEDRRPMSSAAVRGLAESLASRRLRAGPESALIDSVAMLVDRAGPDLDRPTVDFVADALELDDPRAASDLRELTVGPSSRSQSGLAALVDAFLTESAEGLVLLASPDPDWKGCSIDVRGLSTRHGEVSYSVRWHGERPALLWQLAGDGPVTVGCGIDPAWSSTAPAGETLLVPPRNF